MSDTKVIIDVSNTPFQITANREMDVYVIDYDPNNAELSLNDESFNEFIPNPVDDKDNFEDYGTIQKLDVDTDPDYVQQIHEYHKNVDYIPYSQALRQFFDELTSDSDLEEEDED